MESSSDPRELSGGGGAARGAGGEAEGGGGAGAGGGGKDSHNDIVTLCWKILIHVLLNCAFEYNCGETVYLLKWFLW